MGRSPAKQPAMVATAGKKLFEDELRLAASCLERYHFGGSFQWAEKIAAARWAVERIIAHRLRKGDKQLEFWRTKFITEGLVQQGFYLPEEITDSKEARDVILMEAEIRKILPQDIYHPIWPPDRVQLMVSRTPVEICISGIFRTTQYQTLHILDFSPFPTNIDARNDPVIPLKISAIRDFVSKHHSGRPQAIIHQFGYNTTSNITYRRIEDRVVTSKELERVESLVKALEAGLHFPVTPCPAADCIFRSRCFPQV